MRVVPNEAFAGEAAILRKLRRQQLANSLAMLVLVGGILAIAAFFITRSDAWRRPARSEEVPAKVVVALPTPTAPAKAPAPVIAPAAVSPPAFVDPRGKALPQTVDVPKPREPGSRPRAMEPEPRTRVPEPTVEIETVSSEQSVMGYSSAAAAKRVLVSIKCFDQFAYERQAKGRQYFSAVCESGFRRQVSCIGAGCRIEYDRPPPH